ncbi:hypothetical protein GCM10010129_71260 [Streptomyces fumigatiscleroticus]|nr:hypothetical protein GCM10010129_71260 [Streptomyces fumigatiscleroticus]
MKTQPRNILIAGEAGQRALSYAGLRTRAVPGDPAPDGRGTRPRPDGAGGLFTIQELRIAELAGRELSNAAIGDLLRLSPRSVEAYLYRIFCRLGVTARAQLAEALRERQVV